ncbi:hypothetical protein D0Z08_17365 [Nocardioides immobilis]|uniref:Uncharacterized protein n=1 Tax=Nocardioides immobilis TaxID=2049295 RepID=A0A417XZM9_9ACTN|nr:hypothetical protein [Nocardioides immobilis]RHW25811.1 hypothetical protein D0Z08_17365 [Nocardioides immobilis]
MTAALQAWGVGRVGLLIGAAVLLIETTATDQFLLPTFPDRLNGWALVPALVALTMAEPLVDRSPDLTRHATRSPVVIALARLALAYAGAGAVAGYCLLSPDGRMVAAYVLAALSLAAGTVALTGPWYWVPLLPISFAWLQHAAGDFPRPTFAIPAPTLVAVVAGSCLAYVGASAVREEVQRRQ